MKKPFLTFTRREAIDRLRNNQLALPPEYQSFLDDVAAVLDRKKQFPPKPGTRLPVWGPQGSRAMFEYIVKEINDLLERDSGIGVEYAYKVVTKGRGKLPETWQGFYEAVRRERKKHGLRMPLPKWRGKVHP